MSGVRVLVGTAKDAFILTATERYRAQLHQLKDWDEFLLRHSGLPGPRGNLELAQAVAMALQRWFGVVDPDVRWAMKENLKEEAARPCGCGLGGHVAGGAGRVGEEGWHAG